MIKILQKIKIEKNKINIINFIQQSNNPTIKLMISRELLLPIHIENETYFNKTNIIKIIEIMLMHVIFIIGDLYFSIHNCNSPDIIMNVTAYFTLYASIESIWVIYILNLIIKKQDVVLSYNCDAYIFAIYHIFIMMWNILGAFILSNLLDYSCDIELYNYLFVKIIINYFYCVYKLFVICYE